MTANRSMARRFEQLLGQRRRRRSNGIALPCTPWQRFSAIWDLGYYLPYSATPGHRTSFSATATVASKDVARQLTFCRRFRFGAKQSNCVGRRLARAAFAYSAASRSNSKVPKAKRRKRGIRSTIRWENRRRGRVRRVFRGGISSISKYPAAWIAAIFVVRRASRRASIRRGRPGPWNCCRNRSGR